MEYRLRWQRDKKDKLENWENPLLLGDYKLFGCHIKSVSLLAPNDKIKKGILISTDKGSIILNK